MPSVNTYGRVFSLLTFHSLLLAEAGELGLVFQEAFGKYSNMGALGYLVKEGYDVFGFHAYTAVTDCGTYFVFFGGSVDVDVTSKGVFVVRFYAFEPEDSCDDWVASWGIWLEDFSCEFAT